MSASTTRSHGPSAVTPSLSSLAWTTIAADLLALHHPADSVDAHLARSLGLRPHPADPTALTLSVHAEHFRSVHATATPDPETKTWALTWTTTATNDLLAAAVAVTLPLHTATIDPTSPGPRVTDSTHAASNVLRRFGHRLHQAQLEATFAPVLNAFPDATLINASLQPHFRNVSGTVHGRRFEIRLGRKHHPDTAEVTLYRPGPLLPAGYQQIHPIPIPPHIAHLDDPERTVHLLRAALDLDERPELR